MRQREVQDDAGVRWVCAQALAGVETADAEAATALVADDDGRVPVVCTPSGGERSVRVRLAEGWADAASDAELLDAIAGAREA